MSTIFLTISRGGTARNLLQNDFYNILCASGHTTVILTPAWHDERFLKDFSNDHVVFEKMHEYKWNFFDWIFVGLEKMLVYNASTAIRDRFGIYDAKEGNYIKYIFKKIFFLPLSKIRRIKYMVRLLDYWFIPPSGAYDEIFAKYKPDLVFSTSMMEDAEVDITKTAKKLKIKTIGMAKTWDNMSKMLFRVKTDAIIVWGNYSAKEARRYQEYRDREIIICGIPQFDAYCNSNIRPSRDTYWSSLGLDPRKRIIVYGSEGKIARFDPDVVDMIAKFIAQKQLVADAQLFIRPHAMYLNDIDKFKKFEGMANVFIDKSWNPDIIFRDNWDYSTEQITHFTNMLAHGDIFITAASTLNLDAAAFDKPIINVAFDGYNQKPFAESIAKWYAMEHTKNVTKTGANWIVHNVEELRFAINAYFADPSIRSRGRARLREYFAYQIDGGSGQRIASVVLKLLE